MGLAGSRFDGARARRRVDEGLEEDDETTDMDVYSRCEMEGNSYFGSHYMMGGERREMAKPESSLFFTENRELDLLGDKPVPFPYAITKPSDTVIPLNLLVNIRKETIKFIRVPQDEEDEEADGDYVEDYRLYFVFDCDAPGFIRVHVNALEMMDDSELRFAYKDGAQVQDTTIHEFDVGSGQEFCRRVFNVNDLDLAKLQYKGGSFYPIVIEMTCPAVEGRYSQSSQTTVCTITESPDDGRNLIIKPRRQRIAVDGVLFLLQELFGLENIDRRESEEDGYECVVCRDEVRDTVILPCRHLCLCNGCADTLKLKANNCPICRKPFRALVQLKAKRAVAGGGHGHGKAYEQLVLVEALNGPLRAIGSSSSSGDIEEERPRRRRQKVYKIPSKSACPADEVIENEEGIEMTRIMTQLRQRTLNDDVDLEAGIVEETYEEADNDNDESDTTEDYEEDEGLRRDRAVSEPSSVDSRDSSNALLCTGERI